MASLCSYLKFPGRGQRDTPTMTLRGLQRMLMILGGKVASDYRAIVETTFTRVMAGDPSLIKVIEANAASSAPVHAAFRKALQDDPSPGGGPKDDFLDEATLKRKNELDSLAYAERLEELELKKTKRFHLEMETQKGVIEIYKSLSPEGTIDDRARLMFKDNVLNTFTLQKKGECVPEAAADDSRLPVTISTLAGELGLKFTENEYIAIGQRVRNAYVSKYNEPPPKHEQFAGGAVRKVCSYTRRDRELILDVLRGYRK